MVGTPALLDGDFREGCNIQLERPAPAVGSQDEAGQVAVALGVGRPQLLELLRIDERTLRALPLEVQREVLAVALQSADLSALEEDAEPAPEPSAPPSLWRRLLGRPAPPVSRGAAAGAAPAEGAAPVVAAAVPDAAAAAAAATPAAAAPARAAAQAVPAAAAGALGARPAEVGAGRRLLGGAMPHSLLIEKFSFAFRSAPAVLSLGVRDGLQVIEPFGCTMECEGAREEFKEALERRLDQLVATRTAELLEDVRGGAQYATPECVVCMESSPPPDTVLYQCGHRCVHWRCVGSSRLRRCPMCRSPIVAMLQVAPTGEG